MAGSCNILENMVMRQRSRVIDRQKSEYGEWEKEAISQTARA